MSFLDYLFSDSSLFTHIPLYLAWAAGIVFGFRLVRRVGGKTVWLFLAGCISLLLAALIEPFLSALTFYHIAQNEINSFRHVAFIAGLIRGVPVGILDLAGFGCLVAAFLLAFLRKQETT